jgi:hypothetical protein
MVYSVVGFKGNPAAMAPPVHTSDDPYAWLNKTANSWRASQDIGFAWSNIIANLDAQQRVPNVEQLAGPGGYSDLDMLMFGNRKANLTSAESESHLGIWAILKSPLLISTDVTSMTAAELALLTNKRMLSVSQDKLGVQATRVFPFAQQVSGGAVVGTPTPDNYGTPLALQWEELPPSTPSPMAPARQPSANLTAASVRLKNLASGMCLAVGSSTAPSFSNNGSTADGDGGRSSTARGATMIGAIMVTECESKTAHLDWVLTPAGGGKCERGSDALLLKTKVDPSQCLGLVTVNGTAEYMSAGLVPCTDTTARWHYGTPYLNMTFGVFENCGASSALALDAAPWATTNVWAGPIAGGRWAALLFNRGDADTSVTLDFNDLPGAGRHNNSSEAIRLELEVTEVWSGSLTKATGSVSKVLSRHESLFVLLAPASE